MKIDKQCNVAVQHEPNYRERSTLDRVFAAAQHAFRRLHLYRQGMQKLPVPPEMALVTFSHQAEFCLAGFRVGLGFAGKKGLVLLDQLRTLDKLRLVKRLGAVQPVALQTILTTLQAVFDPA